MTETTHKPPTDHIEPTIRHAETNARRDQANQLLSQSGRVVVLTPENNGRVRRRIDLCILPVVLGTYFLQALDKATLAYASIFGLVEDTGLVGHQYSWLGAVVYLAQLVAQPLIAYMLVKMPLGKFLAAVVLAWGVVLSVMPASHNFAGLLASRFFSGLFEAGVAPASISLTQMWWWWREQPLRLGAWYAMNVVYLILVYLFLPDSPVTARFLKGDDKLVAIERLRANNQGVKNDECTWTHVKEAAIDLKTWLWAAMMFVISVPSGGISTFGPLIVKDFGFNPFQTILLNIPSGAVQLVATMLGAYVATVLKWKSPVLAFLCLPPIAGCIMLLYLPRDDLAKGPWLAAYYLISVYPGITPLIYSWSAANTAVETKKKVLGPDLYTTGEAPLYHRGLLSNLVMFVVLIILYGIQVAYLMLLNKRHASTGERMGKQARIIDRSMRRIKKIAKEDMAAHVETGQSAFDDKTDWNNEDFLYVY